MTLDNKLANKTEKTTYQEPYRPHLHFTPEEKWMNDPNGMVFYEGEYHLFYQFHPDSMQWGPMHWGHAVSRDLLEWEHLPVALEPDELGMIFSGSAVVDWHDTSGLFGGGHGLVAIYTSASENTQQQSIAYSTDRGRTWVKYAGNPVIPNTELKDFRDPKVFWHHETSRWVMVLAAGQEIMIYSSPNLLNWTYESSFGKCEGAHGGVWECPDLFALEVEATKEVKWVMQVDIGDGAVAGGSGGQYFVGDFDGRTFVTEPKVTGTSDCDAAWVDYGKDFYATQSFSDIPAKDGRRIWMAWMSNWQYANDVPTSPWRSAMSLPREVSLVQERGAYELIQKPVSELFDRSENIFVDRTISIGEDITSIIAQPDVPFVLDLKMKNVDGDESGRGKMFVTLFQSDSKKGCTVTVDFEQGEVAFDRAGMKNSKFHKQFPAVTTAPFSAKAGALDLQLVVDRGSVEIFIDGGRRTMTNLILPEQAESYAIVVSESGGKTEVDCFGRTIKSVW
ncbi:glycoside hydrolase family 32 protein [Alteribacter keqinensis]|uniref:Glycoside hydrolase family 32 protein n=1 Tax=Alteribacter keqinensis TaxID=2483800 RepID=A0A3M7TRQ0_9BACI|nr:glycoside hydrolase family 32 protein [Alteribacter keqinensis]RNA67710.1 glycoside hydrolase family 32 protein [Alteribacter keqinensis]